MNQPSEQAAEPVVAVMVAAGSGARLGAALPKALVEVDGVPLVRRSLEALVAGGEVEEVVVTTPPTHLSQFRDALADPPVRIRLMPGGERRQDSVRVGAEALRPHGPQAIVLVHDAARPLVPRDVVADVVRAVRDGADAVVPAVAVVDSLRAVIDGQSRVVDRSVLRAVQTPQGFRLGTLVKAHRYVEGRRLEVTDDAAAAEAIGLTVTVVPGHRDALKVTEPIDLVLAEAILRDRARR